MNAVPKLAPIRDPDWAQGGVREEPSVITGLRGPTVEGMHIGTLGKSIKRSDDEVLPIEHEYHRIGHQHGEISMLRKYLPDDVLREALRLYAKQLYQRYRMQKEKS